MRQAAVDTALPLRVLHVIPTLTGGGAENFLCALIAHFDESVVYSGVMPVYPTRVPFNERQLRSIEILRIDRTGRYDTGFLGRMIRGIRRFRPDIVHAHLHNGKYWGRLTALAAHVPIVIFTEHSPQGEKRILPEIFVDDVLNRVTDGVITFTGRQRSMLQTRERIPSQRLTVIENGVPLPPLPDSTLRARARLELGLADDRFVICAVGRQEPVKNMQLGIRALRDVSLEHRASIHLCLVGNGSEHASLRVLARSLGVHDHVTFLGQRDDAVALLYGADALFVPSHVEGMPLAALEAMSVGVPVITTPWPGAEELVDNGNRGILLADWSPAAAAAAFVHASSHRPLLHVLGQRALRFARIRYDIRRAAREHERLYLELARRKGLR
jgi:glycosyltransferase involved in cell wall biosynthesis